MKDPILIEYYKSGTVKRIVPTLNDKIHGVVKDYYPNDNIEGESPVKYGKAHGVWWSYSGLGRLTFEMKFWNGWLLRKIKTYNHKSGSNEGSESFSIRYAVSRNIQKYLNEISLSGNHEKFGET